MNRAERMFRAGLWGLGIGGAVFGFLGLCVTVWLVISLASDLNTARAERDEAIIERNEAIEEFVHCDGMYVDLESVCEEALVHTCAGETYACESLEE